MTIYIDNKKIEANQGESVIEAAQRNNIYVPHFCWHPEMSVAGNCRMCLVEVGTPKRNSDGSFAKDDNGELVITYMPKLQIACNTIVTNEMRVNINTQKCIEARAAVMEFILINHPLDCPICDEAGDCKLQGYSTHYSKGGSRFAETKNLNLKRTQWNDKIMYDAERCISCSRCIRFTRDIVNEDVLTFLNRGDKVMIHRFQDKQIKNEYSMNIIDTCPVGALTSNDFRFKARVWEMSFNSSICTLCGRGCNVSIGTKNNEMLRVHPMPNVYVNKYWMCDYGRLNLADKINNKRLTSPKIYEDTMKTTLWSNAIYHTVQLLKKNKPEEIFIIASTISSNETNYLLNILAKQGLKTNNIGYISSIDNSFADNVLKTKLKSPNTNGTEAFGIKPIDVNKLVNAIKSNTIKTCIVFEEDFSNNPELISAFARLKKLILCVANQNNAVMYANAVLPTATFAEYEGTFTNVDNRVQHFMPVIIAADNIAPMEAIRVGMKRSRLDVFGTKNDKWNQKPDMDFKPSWWIIKEILKHFINIPDYNSANEIFDEIAKFNELFNGMTYELLDKYQGLILGKANSPDPMINNYYSNIIYKKIE
jgi:NADH-quinone oxidoreductase subunit G